MNETNERPELGTTEAAVRSCVNLIALATHTDEEHLAYWLDLYYQTRVSHEGLFVKAIPPSTELTKLDEIDYKIETAVRAVINLVDLIRRGEVAAPSPCAGKAEDGGWQVAAPTEAEKTEAAVAQKKNRAPLTVSERRKLQNAEKEKKRIQGRSDWREFKRATFARLQEAKAGGLTIGAIVAASDGKVTENTVLDILNAVPRPIEDYRALDAALDRCAAE